MELHKDYFEMWHVIMHGGNKFYKVLNKNHKSSENHFQPLFELNLHTQLVSSCRYMQRSLLFTLIVFLQHIFFLEITIKCNNTLAIKKFYQKVDVISPFY